MRFVLKIVSYIFHPLWMPFAGSLLYFILTPRFFPTAVIQGKLLAIAILTIFIPIVFYFLLKNLQKVDSVFLKNVQERRWPLFFFLILIFMVMRQILNVYNYPALYYYFFGIFIATTAALIFSFFKVKISLHMLGLSGFVFFLIALSLHFRTNIIYSILFFVLAMGLTASSRLHYKAHSPSELILGSLCGAIPQVLFWYIWL